MRLSLIIVCCVFIAAVNSVALKPSKSKTPFDYLRTIRGDKSCANGTCPVWEQHGRSFVSLRCYAEQYQECTCLHRMCFRSCIFTREECNQEMVSCLQQICPRCSPASQLGMCSAQNAMAEHVTQALATFACYSCCANVLNAPPSTNNKPSNVNVNGNGIKPAGNIPKPVNINQVNGVGNRPMNGGNVVNVGNGLGNTVNGGNGLGNGGNTLGNGNGGNALGNGNGGNTLVNGGNKTPSNTNQGIKPNSPNAVPTNGLANNNINNPSRSQKITKTVRPANRVVTNRHTSARTTRRTNFIRTTRPVQKPSKTNNRNQN